MGADATEDGGAAVNRNYNTPASYHRADDNGLSPHDYAVEAAADDLVSQGYEIDWLIEQAKDYGPWIETIAGLIAGDLGTDDLAKVRAAYQDDLYARAADIVAGRVEAAAIDAAEGGGASARAGAGALAACPLARTVRRQRRSETWN